MSQHRRKGSHPITDRAGLAALLGASVGGRYDSQRAAARALASLGCHQRQLSRLVRSELGAITERTVGWVMALVPKAKHPLLRSLLLSPKARRLLATHSRWIAARVHEPVLDVASEQDLRRQWLYVQKHYLLSRLGKQFGRLFTEFEVWARKKGHREERIELALERVLAPLLECEPSGFVERHWSELRPKELETFVRAGLARERVLLRRAPEVQRAQEMADSNLPLKHRRDVLRSPSADAGFADPAAFMMAFAQGRLGPG